LKNWFKNPSTDIKLLKSRHEGIEFLMDLSEDALKVIEIALRKTRVSQHIMHQLEKQRKSSDFQALMNFLGSMEIIRDLMIHQGRRAVPKNLSVPDKNDIQTIHDLKESIEKIINFEESKNFGKVVINAGIDDDLDNLQSQYLDLPDFLLNVAKKVYEEEKLASIVPNGINVVYFPQLGFLTVLPHEKSITQKLPLIDAEGIEWHTVFSSEKSLFMKNSKMKMMDQSIGDIYGDISDRELEITTELLEKLQSQRKTIEDGISWIAYLDGLLTLAKSARLYKLTKPILVGEPIIDLKASR
jgi:DNA mismatch repair protein MSH5